VWINDLHYFTTITHQEKEGEKEKEGERKVGELRDHTTPNAQNYEARQHFLNFEIEKKV
jgi:hypothetical protein